MSQIRFRVGHPWNRNPDIDLIKRIARIFYFTDEFVVEKNTGSTWCLNERANNHWMDKDPQTGEFIISHRYHFGGKAEILRKAIIYILNQEQHNKDVEE
jgi:hypothetical protein